MRRSRLVATIAILQSAALAYACGSDAPQAGDVTGDGDGGGGDKGVEAGHALDGSASEALDSAADTDAPSSPNAVVQLALGIVHSCALLRSGDVWCWSGNLLGEMGNGTSDLSKPGPPIYHPPTKVGGLSSVVGIAAGHSHTCAVDKVGAVQCWGANEQMQSGQDTDAGIDSPCGEYPCSVVPRPVAGLGAARSVIAKGNVSCARLMSGELKCWGYNGGMSGTGHGVLGHPLPDLPCKFNGNACNFNPSTVEGAVGDNVVLSTTSGCLLNGTAVSCWGSNSGSELGAPMDDEPHVTPEAVTGLPAITQIGAGDRTFYTVGPGGSLYGWGINFRGEVGAGCNEIASTPKLVVDAGVVAVSGGLHYGCGLSSTGTVSCWGEGAAYGTLGINADAAPTAKCQPPTLIAGLGDVVQLATGYHHACALKTDNTVWCWGDNQQGQLGHDRTTDPSCVVGKCNPMPSKVMGLP
jgi:alpha-tubulin suppressor-like RCC1 family protein